MDMDHAEALELIELAAVEPDGIGRLMAGDTPESATVAGHLAGCPECVAELGRIRRTASIAREVIAGQPDPALRERTLALVREVGRDRSAGAGAVAGPGATGRDQVGATPTPVPEPIVPPVPLRPSTRQAPGTSWRTLAGLAAVLVLAVGLGFAAGILRGPGDGLRREVAVLQETTEATLRLDAQPDTRRIALAATPAGTGSEGTVLFSPTTGEVVMVATGLADPPAGHEYGCWILEDGVRRRIGKMYPGGDLQAWAGPVDGLAGLEPGAVFGVSLVPVGGGAGEPVLTGSL
jgi:hypothetical protein